MENGQDGLNLFWFRLLSRRFEPWRRDFLRCGGQARTVSPVDVTAVRGSQLTYCVRLLPSYSPTLRSKLSALSTRLSGQGEKVPVAKGQSLLLGYQVTMSGETVWQGLAAILPIFRWTELHLREVVYANQGEQFPL